MSERILRIREVQETVALSEKTIHRFVADGRFPAPVKLGEKVSGWRESDVQAWIAELKPAPGR